MNAAIHFAHAVAAPSAAAVAVGAMASIAGATVVRAWSNCADQVLPVHQGRTVVRIRKTVGLKPRWPGGFERGNPRGERE